VLDELYRRDIISVMVEGGPTLLNSLVEAGLWDEAGIFIGPGWLGSGVKAPDFPFRPVEVEQVGNSELLIFHNTW
jgi:diaminohydroxyphosphoribosylaminopyrimidine deaminase/5-amino-6-(5-phosphoribosylamino)uracil reductase